MRIVSAVIIGPRYAELMTGSAKRQLGVRLDSKLHNHADRKARGSGQRPTLAQYHRRSERRKGIRDLNLAVVTHTANQSL